MLRNKFSFLYLSTMHLLIYYFLKILPKAGATGLSSNFVWIWDFSKLFASVGYALE